MKAQWGDRDGQGQNQGEHGGQRCQRAVSAGTEAEGGGSVKTGSLSRWRSAGQRPPCRARPGGKGLWAGRAHACRTSRKVQEKSTCSSPSVHCSRASCWRT